MLSSMLFSFALLSLFCQTAWTVTIPVTSADDFSKIQVGPMTFELQNDITTDTIAIASQSGITIRSTPGQTFTIKGTSDQVSLILIENSNDITFENVNLQYVTPSSAMLNADCPQKSVAFPGQTVNFDYVKQCSALHVGYSTNIVIRNCTSFGRLSATFSSSVLFDSLDITTNFVQDGIDIFGNGNVTDLGNITISNSYIHDTSNGITAKSIGATVANNYIDGWAFAGVQVDIDVHNTCTSGFVHIVSNYFRRLKGNPTGADGAAVYMDTHWCSTGNIVEDNFFWNEDVDDSRIMIYLDFTTSNQLVQNNIGMNIGGGRVFKINTGHYNSLFDNVIVNANHMGTIGCENGGSGDRNNCNNYIGQSWYSNGLADSEYTALIPWWSTLCSAKSYNGTECTTSSAMDSAYGGCSGVPHGNKLNWIVNGLTNGAEPLPAKDNGQICPDGQTNAAELNSFTTETFTGDVFSVLPSTNSLPQLSSSFIAAYPQFANFIENLGPNGNALIPPPMNPASAGGNNIVPSGTIQTSPMVSTGVHPLVSGRPLNPLHSTFPVHTPKSHPSTSATAKESSAPTPTTVANSYPAAAAGTQAPESSVTTASSDSSGNELASGYPGIGSMTIIVPSTGPMGGAMVTMLCKAI